jgi:hypothetical protein
LVLLAIYFDYSGVNADLVRSNDDRGMVCSADPPIPVFGYRHDFHQHRSTQRAATIPTATTKSKTGILWNITIMDQTLPPLAYHLVLETF